MIRRPFRIPLLLVALLTGCATPPTPAPMAVTAEPPTGVPAAPQAATPMAVPVAPTAPATPPPAAGPLPAKPPESLPAWADPRAGRALLEQALPRGIADRAGWANDIFAAFTALKVPYTADYLCGAMAVIEQESGWQADPVVPGLGKDVWKELEHRAGQHHVPMAVVKATLQFTSRTGRSYAQRIDALRTEGEMNALFEEMVADAHRVGLPVQIANPIRTGGPMQVSVAFAEAHAKAWPYPYPVQGSLRHDVFSRRGGVYFGIAHLLHYRAPYTAMLYRFADFNAGRYASRNAAFQQALARLSHRRVAMDGDLIRFDGTTSETERVLLAMAGKLKMGAADIHHDLAQEETEAFYQSTLYQRLFALADAQAGKPAPREALPQIRLISTKITRKLTTAWFAQRVNGRFRQCLARVRP